MSEAFQARFYDHAPLDVEESRKQNREVYHDSKLLCELVSKGKSKESISKPATDELKERFPRAWAEYCGKAYDDGSTELSMLKFDLGRVQELKAMGIRSVEDLADVSDAQIQNVREGYKMRKTAQDFLEGQRLAGQVSMSDFEAMKAQIEELQKANEALQKPKRGRPRKEDEDASGTV